MTLSTRLRYPFAKSSTIRTPLKMRYTLLGWLTCKYFSAKLEWHEEMSWASCVSLAVRQTYCEASQNGATRTTKSPLTRISAFISNRAHLAMAGAENNRTHHVNVAIDVFECGGCGSDPGDPSCRRPGASLEGQVIISTCSSSASLR